MALTIYLDDQDPGGAMAVHRAAGNLRPSLQGDADMGRFWISRSGPEPHVLTTCGAGPCMIIIIRDADGGGGLGHYGGTPHSGAILSGLTAMVRKLGSQQITDVLFAAGQIGDGDTQARYDNEIVAGAARICPMAGITRIPLLANGEVASEAVFLPRDGRVALFGDNSPGRFWGTGGETGLEKDSYPAY